ncbi:hypothetical protein [Rhizobium metallidurans]|nr:hypothetical protein [Rhizobium metallidurans]
MKSPTGEDPSGLKLDRQLGGGVLPIAYRTALGGGDRCPMGNLYDEYSRKGSEIGASQQCVFGMCLSVAVARLLIFLAISVAYALKADVFQLARGANAGSSHQRWV